MLRATVFSVLFFLLAFLPTAPLCGQEDRPAVTDLVFLNNGEVYSGRITDLELGKYLTLQTTDGRTLTFAEAEIARVDFELQHAETTTGLPIKRKKEFTPDHGWFSMASFGLTMGRGEQSAPPDGGFRPNRTRTDILTGFNLQYVQGYQFSRWLGLGLGGSWDGLALDRGEHLFSLLGEYRAFLSEGRLSPYLMLNGGYSFALKNASRGIDEAQGGWMWHPSLGLRLAGNDSNYLFFDAGYRFQQARYSGTDSVSVFEERQVKYRRLFFRLGIQF